MKTTTTQALYSYWNEIRRDRMAPFRFEVEPSRFSRILSQTFILEHAPSGGCHFRLAGTRICEEFGRELRGAEICDLLQAPDRPKLDRILTSIVNDGAVGVVQLESRAPTGQTVSHELLLLPLIHSGNTIARLLGSLSAVSQPAWLGTVPLTQHCVKQANLIWPDGRPAALLRNATCQQPFSADPVPKRVIRSERRCFRVFDGGRDGKPDL